MGPPVPWPIDNLAYGQNKPEPTEVPMEGCSYGMDLNNKICESPDG